MLAFSVAIIVLVTLPNASARSKLDLGRITSGRLVISDEGGGNLRLRLCDKVVHRKCVGDRVEGPAWASGQFGHIKGFYVVEGNALTTGTFTGCVAGVCNWTLSGGSYNFEFRQNRNGEGTDFLSGALEMISLTEVPTGKHFSVTMTLNLRVTGGTLAPYFDDHGNVVLFYRFTTDKFLGGISEFYQQFETLPPSAPEP